MRPAVLIAALVLIAPLLARAQAGPPFESPLACGQDTDCWIFRYTDTDPGPGGRDYRCGDLSYNDHRGTDIAIRDEIAMAAGVPVRAVADGVVRGRRDGMADISMSKLPAGALKGRECGNGVVIDHGNGWQSQYCHLRRDSVRVAVGEPIRRGTPLGLVGLSGETTFPHVHLTLRYNDRPVDPFTGAALAAGACRRTPTGETGLWTPEAAAALPRYQPVVLYALGMGSAEVDRDAIIRGGARRDRLGPAAPRVNLWVYVVGLAAGDQVALELRSPDGRGGARVFTAKPRPDRGAQNAQWYRAGLNRPPAGWPPGRYDGTVTVTRTAGGAPIVARTSVRIE